MMCEIVFSLMEYNIASNPKHKNMTNLNDYIAGSKHFILILYKLSLCVFMQSVCTACRIPHYYFNSF